MAWTWAYHMAFHGGWPGLERSETPEFWNVAHRTLRGFLRCASSSPGHPLRERLLSNVSLRGIE